MQLSKLFRRKAVEEILIDAVKDHSSEGTALRRDLGVIDLTAFGIAAIIGAGIFTTIGNVAYNGGPACIFLFLFTAIACTFSAFCYAEFASRIPIAGSAYTYAYASFGELIAWIIGWDLLMEYAISNIAVAISWSDYFSSLMDAYGLGIPEFLTMDFLSAKRAHSQIEGLLAEGQNLLAIQNITELGSAYKGYLAWTNSPVFLGMRIVCDVPALLIISLVTVVTYIGIRESKMTSNIMVLIKLTVVLLVIGVGAFYVRPQHWVPFAPNGVSGVIRGIAGVFFAYIGFDAISTTAEECKDPQRDLPRGMLYSLFICTVLYVLIALVLTGMVSYKQLAVGDPLAYVFGPEGVNLPIISTIVSFSAIIAMATVLLVYQIGQPRIWMAMSRDGLLPPIFSSIHPRFHTPWFSTLVTGIMVAVPALFMNLTEVTDLTSIGTLFAFVLVCSGVLVLQEKEKSLSSTPRVGFRIPYFNSKYIVPALVLMAIAAFLAFTIEERTNFSFSSQYIYSLLPMSIFLILACVVAFICFKRELSLIPVLGLLCCLYLITQLGLTNWLRFAIWLLIGLFLYFAYGNRHSKLEK